MNPEARLINAVCKNKDIHTLLEGDVDMLFTSYGDVWEKGVKGYYYKYGSVPDAELIAEKFRDFDIVDTGTTPTKFFVNELRDDFIKSRLRNAFLDKNSDLNSKSGAQVLNEMFAELGQLNKLTNNIRDLDLTNFEAAEKDYKERAERAAMMGGTVGIPTGLAAIDSAYSTGMAPGHLIVVIGWPGKGKTWMTAYLACLAHERGFKPMIVSLEMSPETMRDRVYTMMGSGTFSNSDLARGDVDLDDFHSWGKKKFHNKGKFVLVSAEGYETITPNTVQAKIEQHQPDLVICDYHQLFEDNKQSRNEVERNKNVSREFKQLAMRNRIPVIDITAATADDISDRDNAPMLSQVAWSKAIEYDADMAMAVHKSSDSNLIEIVSRKNRHGGDFAFYLDWDIDRGIISEVY
jgi:replicative DNA helicase